MKKNVLFAILMASLWACKSSPNLNTEPSIQNQKWWKEAIVYQIYPRSFKDSNGDGIGDLQGIIQSLDYIQSLGVNAIWLNPIYSSPNFDNGYDVSDYRNIMKDFGTMQDFEALLKGLHDRKIKLIMDIVVNHSSNEHEWFKQSRSSRTNPYRNYYHWWPAEKGKPNYRYSLFDEKGDAWKYDSLTNAYYLHYFSEQQPDLNWENPKLRMEVYDIMKFWAEKGVDGFRLDAFQFVAKDTTFPKINDDLEKNFIQHYAMQNPIHEYLKEMNTEVLSKYDVMSVAEGAGRNFKDAHDLVDEDRQELNMAYAFEGVDIPNYKGFSLAKMKEVFSKWDAEFAKKGWLSVFLSNHDQARMVSRWGNDAPAFRTPSAKMLNTFILTMRGTPYCYYGDELGMTNIRFKNISEYNDIQAINGYKKAQAQGKDMNDYMQFLQFSSRDNGRTPMQWNASAFAGFSTVKPWLPVNANYLDINVENELKASNSVLEHFKSLTKMRTENPIWVYGSYELVQKEHPTVYAYTRTLGKEKRFVLLNFSAQKSNIELKNFKINATPIMNNYDAVTVQNQIVELQPYQAVVFEVEG